MTAEKIKNRIAEMCTLFGFEYNGKVGNVDPCYNPDTKRNEFLLFFDGNEQEVYTIDEVMQTPLFDGKSLEEIANDIDIIEW